MEKRWVARTCLAILAIATVLVIAMALVPATAVDLVISTLRGTSALPDPTGTWSGTWLSYIALKGGIANFNLVYDPLTLTVAGTAGLLLNKLIPVPISVTGLNTATGFTLTGSYFDPVSLTTFHAECNCTLVSPTYLTGHYLIHDVLYVQTDAGEFNLDLSTGFR
jgi:hypothetical protein